MRQISSASCLKRDTPDPRLANVCQHITCRTSPHNKFTVYYTTSIRSARSCGHDWVLSRKRESGRQIRLRALASPTGQPSVFSSKKGATVNTNFRGTHDRPQRTMRGQTSQSEKRPSFHFAVDLVCGSHIPGCGASCRPAPRECAAIRNIGGMANPKGSSAIQHATRLRPAKLRRWRFSDGRP